MIYFVENLWKKRTPPIPLTWDVAIKTGSDGVETNDVKTNEMNVWSISKCAKMFEKCINILKEEVANKKILVWDKDDKPAMDFVTACANIRAQIFSIPQKSRFDIKCNHFN